MIRRGNVIRTKKKIQFYASTMVSISIAVRLLTMTIFLKAKNWKGNEFQNYLSNEVFSMRINDMIIWISGDLAISFKMKINYKSVQINNNITFTYALLPSLLLW